MSCHAESEHDQNDAVPDIELTEADLIRCQGQMQSQ